MSKKNFSLLLILTPLMIALAFAVANFFWRVSYIIGLDNISPYWGLEILVYRAFHSGNFFLYGPSLFNLPVIFAGLIGLTPSILSKLNTALPFIVGMAGYIVLVRLSLGASVKEKRTAIREAFSLVSGLLLVIGSLISIWIFNQPVTIFLAMFAALPWTVLLLQRKDRTVSNRVGMILLILGLLLGVIYLFLSSLNLVAFFLLVPQVLLLAAMLNFAQTRNVNKANSLRGRVQFLITESRLKEVTAYTLLLLLSWAVIVQGLLLFTPEKNFLPREIIRHASSLQSSESIDQVTSDLRQAELTRNTLVNSFRYATGWMELHDATGESIFQYYDTYNSTLFVLLGLTPVLFIFATSYRKVREDRKILALIAVYTMTVLMISKYGVMLMGNFYYLENALRWASSKLWPAILVTYLALFIVLMRALDFKKFKTVSIGMILLLLLYSLPWLQGKVLSNYVNVEMPDEYYTTFSAFDQQDKVLYYPPPQQLYFRQYDWGYFGSDFLNFMTKAEVIDIATVSDVNDFYFEMTELLQTCSADELKANGITHVVVDGSVTDHGDLTLPNCAIWEVVEENEYFVVYEL